MSAKNQNSVGKELVIMENKEMTKGRFNFVDVLIIVMVLAIIAVVVYMSVSDKKVAASSEKVVTYTVKLSGVNKDYLPLIKKGETVTDSSTGALIGTITDVTSEKSKHVGSKITADTLGNRYISYSEYDNLYDVFVTMTVKADVDSRGIAYVNKNKVLVGSKIYFRCGTFAAASFCTAFSIE
mgnify:CR=1 FL=1